MLRFRRIRSGVTGGLPGMGLPGFGVVVTWDYPNLLFPAGIIRICFSRLVSEFAFPGLLPLLRCLSVADPWLAGVPPFVCNRKD